MSAWPGGHHSREGFSGQRTGTRAAGSSLGTRCWENDSGRPPGLPKPGRPRAMAASESASVEKLFISSKGRGARQRWRRNSICRTMMSRKVRPFLATMRDLACSRPMLVPRPPLSLRTTVWRMASSATASASSRSSSRGRSPSSPSAAPGMTPRSPSIHRRTFRRKASTTSGGAPSPAIRARMAASMEADVTGRTPYSAGSRDSMAWRSWARRSSRRALCIWWTRRTSAAHCLRGNTSRRSTGR